MSRSKVSRKDGRRDENGVVQLFGLQSAIGNRASAALMREAATNTPNAAPTAQRGQKTAFMTIEGETQGKFKGSAKVKGREDSIAISNYRLSVNAPRDVATGEASGKRQYKAISFKKGVDAASPQFMQALTKNEVLKEVVIRFYGPAPESGVDRMYQTVTLKNARLASWTQDFESGEDTESVELVFEEIQLDSTTGGTTVQDTWKQQK